MVIRETVTVGDKELTIETGRVAKQADGSVVLRYGDTMVLVSAVADRNIRDVPFLPLTVDYTEKMYAAGRIPGSFFRREGRPSTPEVLTCRIIDRPIRPLFPKGWRNETQVIAMVLSTDRQNPADVLALTGASAALTISDIPWAGPLAGVRVGRVDGKLIANPTEEQQKAGDMSIVVACSFDAVVMVEGACRFVSEQDIVDALLFAQEQTRPILELQEKIRAAVGKPKRPFEEKKVSDELVARVRELGLERLKQAIDIREKLTRYAAIHDVEAWVLEQLGEEYAERAAEVGEAFDLVKRQYVRGMVANDSVRIDGRRLDQVRPITCEVGVLPRVHGSALFTRGETQSLVVTTLATHTLDQRIESVMGDYQKSFLLHYNFPPFSTGEAKRFGSPGRREIGHGNLAERSLTPVLPAEADFPYALRVVSEILESNGSSSMATVCGGSLSLMDAGVPTKGAVAGIAMGLIKEGDTFAVLSDILGDEDHMGDMDFKVAGTREGVTAIQMDIKLDGLPPDVLARALQQAREGRLHILDRMAEAIEAPRANLSPTAPRILTIRVKPDRIRDIIGAGGKTIRAIQDESGAEVDVSDDGTVLIASADEASARKAIDLIEGLTAEAEMGAIYRGKVRRVTNFGAFIEILPGVDGMVHISELDRRRVERVEDVCREGDEVVVKVVNIDRDGKIRLSRKEALDAQPHEIRSMV
jgi:polyribonucleotide nucleotidyltransferase